MDTPDLAMIVTKAFLSKNYHATVEELKYTLQFLVILARLFARTHVSENLHVFTQIRTTNATVMMSLAHLVVSWSQSLVVVVNGK